jgi:hypothetical protein
METVVSSSRSRLAKSMSDRSSMGGGGGGSHGTWTTRLERASFGVWHLMLDSRANGSGWAGVAAALLLIPRFLTTASLAVSPRSRLRDFMSLFQVDNFFAIKGDPGVFLAGYAIALAIVWVSLACAASVAVFISRDHFTTFAPALFLRAVVGLFITALLNPLIELFLLPMNCQRLAVFFPNTPAEAAAGGFPASFVLECGSGIAGAATDGSVGVLQAVLMILSALSLAAFIPFAVATKGVYLDTDPISGDITAARTGRLALFDTAARAALVFATAFLKDRFPALHAVLILAFTVPLAAYTALRAPFYRTGMNALNTAMYAFVAWLAVEALVIYGEEGVVTETSAPTWGEEGAATLATASILALVIPLALAAPYAEDRVLRGTLADVLAAVRDKEQAERARMLSRGSFVTRATDAKPIHSAHLSPPLLAVGGGNGVVGGVSAGGRGANAAAAAAAAASAALLQRQLNGGGGARDVAGPDGRVLTGSSVGTVSHTLFPLPDGQDHPSHPHPHHHHHHQHGGGGGAGGSLIFSDSHPPVSHPGVNAAGGVGNTSVVKRTGTFSAGGRGGGPAEHVVASMTNTARSIPHDEAGGGRAAGGAAAAASTPGSGFLTVGFAGLGSPLSPERPSSSLPPLGSPISDPTSPSGRIDFISVRDGSMQSAAAARLFRGRPDLVGSTALLAAHSNPRPDILSAAEHRRHIKAGFYPREAVSRAESVFELGLLAFPLDAVVIVAYARFLGSFVKDSSRASGMLKRVAKLNPALEERFALFSYGRFLDQRRAKEDLGEGLDGLGLLAFRQGFATALSACKEAVSHIAVLWRAIDAHKKAVARGAAGITATAAGRGRGVGGSGAGRGSAGPAVAHLEDTAEEEERALRTPAPAKISIGASSRTIRSLSSGRKGAAGGSVAIAVGADPGAAVPVGSARAGGGGVPALLTTASLMDRIGRVVSARRAAQSEFNKLLSRYPSAAQVLTLYATFLDVVWMDAAEAASAAVRADAAVTGAEVPEGHTSHGDEEPGARAGSMAPTNGGKGSMARSGGVGSAATGLGSSSGGSGAPSGRRGGGGGHGASSMGGGSSSRGGGDSTVAGGGAGGGGASAASRISRFSSVGTAAVYRLQRRMQLGSILLALLSIVIFSVTRAVLEDFSSLVDSIYLSGRRRFSVVAAAYHTRTCSLATMTGILDVDPTMRGEWESARAILLTEMESMSETNTHLYDPNDARGVRLFPAVRALYDEPIMKLNYITGPLNVSRTVGFLEGAQTYAGSALEVAHEPAALVRHPVSDFDAPWRYVQDNWYFLFVGADRVVKAYVQRAFDIGDIFSAVSWTLFALVTLILAFIWVRIFKPSVRQVQASNAGVVDIVEAIPSAIVAMQVKKYTALEISLHAETDKMRAAADGDGDSVRSVGSDDGGNGRGSGSDDDDDDDDDASSGSVSSGGDGGTRSDRSELTRSTGSNGKGVGGGGGHTARNEHGGGGGARRSRRKEDGRGDSRSVRGRDMEGGGGGGGGGPRGERGRTSARRTDGGEGRGAAGGRGGGGRSGGGEASAALLKPEIALAVASLRSPGDPGAVSVMSPAAAAAGAGAVASENAAEVVLFGREGHPAAPATSQHPHRVLLGVEETPDESPASASAASEGAGMGAAAHPHAAPPTPLASALSPRRGSALRRPGGGGLTSASASFRIPTDAGGTITVLPGADDDEDVSGTPVMVVSAADADGVVEGAGASRRRLPRGNKVAPQQQELQQAAPSRIRTPASAGARGGEEEGEEEASGGGAGAGAGASSGRAGRSRRRLRTAGARSQAQGGGAVAGGGGGGPPRKGSAAAAGAATLSPLLRALSRRMAAALTLLFALQALATALNTSEVNASTYTASSIDIAGFRRELAVTASFQARELIVSPDIIGTYELAAITMREYVDKFRAYHRALLLGDAGLRLEATIGLDPEQDALLFQPDASRAYAFTPAANLTTSVGDASPVATQGLNYLILNFLHEADQFLTRYEPWWGSPATVKRYADTYYGGTTPPYDAVASGICLHNLTCINADPEYARLQIMSFSLLDRLLERSIGLFLAQVQARANRSLVTQVTVLIANLAVLALLYFVGLRRSFFYLNQEATRTLELVKLIPAEAIEGSARLRSLIHVGDGDGGGGGGGGESDGATTGTDGDGDGGEGGGDGNATMTARGTRRRGVSRRGKGGGGEGAATPGA